MKNKVNILWTGGWDSTYRMIELSRKDLDINPIYICDTTRPSLQIEIKTIKKLYQMIVEDKRTIANVQPIKYVEFSEIKKNEEITKAYERLKKGRILGSQYEYIARLAYDYSEKIELGIEKPNGEISGCVETIETYGKIVKKNGTYILDKENSSEDLNLIFGNISFPIIDKTEIEMLENIKKWDYVNLMQNIHFCYTPHNGQPCGYCRPCQQKIECGMEILLPKKAKVRYRIYKWRLENNNILRKIIWKLCSYFI